MRDVCFHVLVALDLFDQVARNGEWDLDEIDYPSTATASDITTALGMRADRAAASWSSADSLDRECSLPFGRVRGSHALGIHCADLVVHSWDIATGRGASISINDALAEFALAVDRALITPEMRGEGLAFAPESAPPPAAGSFERLLAFVGRRPS